MTHLSLCCGAIMHNMESKICPKCGKDCEVVDERIFETDHSRRPDYGFTLPSLEQLPHGEE